MTLLVSGLVAVPLVGGCGGGGGAAAWLRAGPWHDTSGDTGSGDPGTVVGSGMAAFDSAKVVVGSSGKCVWICCPPAPEGGTPDDCPTTDQCP
jgi:hypothetical protein